MHLLEPDYLAMLGDAFCVPLLYVLGSQQSDESASFAVDGLELGSIGMLSVAVGAAGAWAATSARSSSRKPPSSRCTITARDTLTNGTNVTGLGATARADRDLSRRPG